MVKAFKVKTVSRDVYMFTKTPADMFFTAGLPTGVLIIPTPYFLRIDLNFHKWLTEIHTITFQCGKFIKMFTLHLNV